MAKEIFFMAKEIFFSDIDYERTSDEWKEYVHTHTYRIDARTGKIFHTTVTEFQNTRDGSDTITRNDTIEVDRTKLSRSARAALKVFEKKR